ncbi:hypothetical protein OIU77_008658 [Salix suchowensis]|uniref:Non-haem dioxygenase N-terminal domain-containing protein n=1 Tax=Salix suchowensis TaxID=1278906 RepID=A0ABQ9ABP0_9ROSI|nr:hypothetical protein OIU77_008658 [Salix suchowensis]
MSPTLLQEVSDHHALAGAKKASYTHSDPLSEIPTLSGVDISADGSTPVIDMEALLDPRRSDAIKQIGLACEKNGFFAVKNHGIPEMKINNMLDTAREFFHLPDEERLKFRSADPGSVIRLVTGFQDKTRNVFVSRQSLKFHCHPVEEYKSHWPSNPPSFRENVGEYCESVRKVEAISNYKYKSLLHQAIVNCEKERVSIASYCYPSDDAMIGPAKKLIDKVHPAIYKDFTYREFHESMWRVKCSTAKRLDLFKPSSD